MVINHITTHLSKDTSNNLFSKSILMVNSTVTFHTNNSSRNIKEALAIATKLIMVTNKLSKTATSIILCLRHINVQP